MSYHIVAVALGGALGSLARYGLQATYSMGFIGSLPMTLIFINSLGCFLMGIFLHSGLTPPSLRDFITVGFLGGFTTFSAFSAEFWLLLEKNSLCTLSLYLIASIAIPLMLFFIGTRIALSFF